MGALALAFGVGTGLGLLYFVGLWLTVRALPTSRRPVLLALGSTALRSVFLVGGMALVAREHPERWVLCLAGFLLARLIAVWPAHSGGRRRPVEER